MNILNINNNKTAYVQIPLLILFLIIPFLQSGSLLDQGLLPRFMGLQAAMLIMIGMLLGKSKKLQGYNSPLLIIYFLFVVYSGLHLFWGNVFSDSVFEWLKVSSYFLLLLLLLQLYTFKKLKSAIPLFLSVLGIIISVLGTMELFQSLQNGKLSIPLDTYQIKTTFGHRNLYLQVLFLTFPFQVYRSLTAKRTAIKWVHILFSVLSLFLLIVLSNRAIWLALLLGFGALASLAYLALWQKNKLIINPEIGIKNLRFIIAPLFVTLMLSGLFFLFLTETTEAKKHFGEIIKLEKGSGKDRLELWERTLKIIGERPVFGCGAANWKIEVLKYGNKGLVSEDNITFYQRPHNDFLWIFSEYGIIGGLLYLLLFLWAFASLIKQLYLSKHSDNILFFSAVLFSLIGFTVFSFFSFPHERIAHNILLSTLLAIIITGGDTTKYFLKQRVLKTAFLLISAIFIIASSNFAYQRFVSEMHTKKAIIAKTDNNRLKVINEIKKAESSYYQMDPLSTPLKWYSGLAYYQEGKMDSALSHFKQAQNLNPYHVHVLNNLASAYGQKGKTGKAIDFYKKTLGIYPGFEEASLNLCAVYFNLGDTDSAILALRNINIETTDPKFKTFVTIVLKEKITEMLKEKKPNMITVSLPNDEEWYFTLFHNSIINDIPLDSLIFAKPKPSNNINLKSE